MKILIPLDGSSLSEAALDTARSIATVTDAEVHLLRVEEPPPPPPASERREHPGVLKDPMSDLPIPEYIPLPPRREPVEKYEQTVARAERELLEYLQDKAAIFVGRPLNCRAAFSRDIAQEIVGYARAMQIDLIIMATHGRSGLAMLVQGSVAHEVLRSGVAPITLVCPKGP